MASLPNDGPTSLDTSNPYVFPDSGEVKEDTSTSVGPASIPIMFNPQQHGGERG